VTLFRDFGHQLSAAIKTVARLNDCQLLRDNPVLWSCNKNQVRGDKVKLSLCEDVWKSGGIAPSFFTLAVDGGEWSASRPGRYDPGKEPPVPSR
jgi:hypothetical protein